MEETTKWMEKNKERLITCCPIPGTRIVSYAVCLQRKEKLERHEHQGLNTLRAPTSNWTFSFCRKCNPAELLNISNGGTIQADSEIDHEGKIMEQKKEIQKEEKKEKTGFQYREPEKIKALTIEILKKKERALTITELAEYLEESWPLSEGGYRAKSYSGNWRFYQIFKEDDRFVLFRERHKKYLLSLSEKGKVGISFGNNVKSISSDEIPKSLEIEIRVKNFPEFIKLVKKIITIPQRE